MSLMCSAFSVAYGALWRAAEPFLRKHKRLADGFDQRLVPDDWPERSTTHGRNPAAVRIWIQAASGGEAGLCRALVPALAQSLRAHATPALSLELLLTTCTRQGLDVLESLAAPENASLRRRYFPLDRPDLMRKALRLFDPQALVLLETELWPGLLQAAKERGLPVIIVNGRMTGKSYTAYRLGRRLLRRMAPERVLAVSRQDAERFAALFGPASRVEVMPNIKFDLAAGCGQPPRRVPRGDLGVSERELLVLFASVREEEEKALLPVIRALHGQAVEQFRVVAAVAPRHMHRLPAWQTMLDAAGLPWRPRSAGTRNSGLNGVTPVLLVDTFGELHSLYDAADAVFVGGSLAPLGGQNFLEAMAQGKRPTVGPSVDNFHWAGEDVFTRGLVLRVENAEALRAVLHEQLQRLAHDLSEPAGYDAGRERSARAVQEHFAAWLGPRLGGSAKAAQAVIDRLLALCASSG